MREGMLPEVSDKKDWIHRSLREQSRTAVIADCQCHRMQSEKTKQ